MEGVATVDINVFKDVLWDLMNESDALDVSDIESVDKENRFIVAVRDGSLFQIQISVAER